MWKHHKFCEMGPPRKAVVVQFVIFTIGFLHQILPAVCASNPTCPQYKYYDHGTDDCENCNEICNDKAEHMRTIEQCWDNCPAYAKIIWPNWPSIKLPTTPAPPKIPPPETKEPTKVPVDVIGIVFAAVAVMGMGIVGVAAFKKRRVILAKLRRRPAGDEEARDTTQLKPMLVAQPLAGVAGSASGIQEIGEQPCCTPDGQMPFHGIPVPDMSTDSGQPQEARLQSSPPALPVPASASLPRAPVPVSDHWATNEMAFPAAGQALSPYMSSEPYSPDCSDWDTTEPKSPQPSLSLTVSVPEGDLVLEMPTSVV